jgi:putative DNA primase/helicase
LRAPEIVTAATAKYLEAEDALAAWIEDCCDRDPNAWTASRALFASWTAWATKAGEFIGSQKRFSQTLEARGFVEHRQMHGRGFLGLRVTSEWSL